MARNRPELAVVPIYGPDAYSRAMASAGMAMSNPVSPASVGPGIIRYTPQTDDRLPPRQNFVGMTGAIRRAENATLPAAAELPEASADAQLGQFELGIGMRRQGLGL